MNIYPNIPFRLLIIDDTPANLLVLTELLASRYLITVANSGPRALQLISEGLQPDLILLDVMMPDMDGYEVLHHLQQNQQTRNIPVIFVTARNAPEDEARGLELGAADYVTKPINPVVVQARIQNLLLAKASHDFLTDHTGLLSEEVARRTQEIETVQTATVLALTSLAETRDNETGNHILRTQRYVRVLAEHLGASPRYSGHLTRNAIQLLYMSAPLHDIGKIGIPDSILLKPDRLTPEEFEIMKSHTIIGYRALARAEEIIGKELEFLRPAKEIARSHQEKWDGSGYPDGLSEELIPLSARLMAVADVYDALISKRVYKPAYTHEQAIAIMREGRGRHFDPAVLDAMLAQESKFRQIALQFLDD